MIDVRCKSCGKILLKASLLQGAIKCHRCYMIFEYYITNNKYVTDQYDPKVLHSKTKDDNIGIATNESTTV